METEHAIVILEFEVNRNNPILRSSRNRKNRKNPSLIFELLKYSDLYASLIVHSAQESERGLTFELIIAVHQYHWC